MEFKAGPIEGGVRVEPLKPYGDERGWLMELFRRDKLADDIMPVMAYMSVTKPGVVRGPHEHFMQSDYFCFTGPGVFKLVLWDNRPTSLTFRNRCEFLVGTDQPSLAIVPPHVVHAYKNVSDEIGYVFNAANQLYRGWNYSYPVDEIRHELNPNSPFKWTE